MQAAADPFGRGERGSSPRMGIRDIYIAASHFSAWVTCCFTQWEVQYKYGQQCGFNLNDVGLGMACLEFRSAIFFLNGHRLSKPEQQNLNNRVHSSNSRGAKVHLEVLIAPLRHSESEFTFKSRGSLFDAGGGHVLTEMFFSTSTVGAMQSPLGSKNISRMEGDDRRQLLVKQRSAHKRHSIGPLIPNDILKIVETPNSPKLPLTLIQLKTGPNPRNPRPFLETSGQIPDNEATKSISASRASLPSGLALCTEYARTWKTVRPCHHLTNSVGARGETHASAACNRYQRTWHVPMYMRAMRYAATRADRISYLAARWGAPAGSWAGALQNGGALYVDFTSMPSPSLRPIQPPSRPPPPLLIESRKGKRSLCVQHTLLPLPSLESPGRAHGGPRMRRAYGRGGRASRDASPVVVGAEEPRAVDVAERQRQQPDASSMPARCRSHARWRTTASTYVALIRWGVVIVSDGCTRNPTAMLPVVFVGTEDGRCRDIDAAWDRAESVHWLQLRARHVGTRRAAGIFDAAVISPRGTDAGSVLSNRYGGAWVPHLYLRDEMSIWSRNVAPNPSCRGVQTRMVVNTRTGGVKVPECRVDTNAIRRRGRGTRGRVVLLAYERDRNWEGRLRGDCEGGVGSVFIKTIEEISGGTVDRGHGSVFLMIKEISAGSLGLGRRANQEKGGDGRDPGLRQGALGSYTAIIYRILVEAQALQRINKESAVGWWSRESLQTGSIARVRNSNV
ncbi:hypothetical protein C8R46DRAFT_1191591 [Mycena filopes]|nr:hypothetical protein C8R46DRAFT_1191591 [Mycena filopes]